MPRRTAPSPDDLETKTAHARAGSATWLVISAASGVTSLELPPRAEITIGRAATSIVPIDDESVSRRHAVLRVDGGLTIEDLGSRNGTRVRGRALEPGERAAIEVGSVIEIGHATLLVQAAPPSRSKVARDATRTGASEPVVRDPTMLRLHALLDVIAPSPLHVLLLGETGTGKEVFAAEIHARSTRASGPFVKVNCASLSGSLLEAELFGHEKGAFTGAVAAKRGLFEAAHGGTLFLDELGEMPIETQAKLLRVIEHGEVTRLGSTTPTRVDVRFVGATNRDLAAASASGAFRSDLYFRLDGFSLTLPPLRKRAADVEPLAVFFAAGAAKRAGRSPIAISELARAKLLAHAWPGNVRELKAVIERAVVLAGKSTAIEPEHVVISALAPAGPAHAARGSETSLGEELRAREKKRIVDALLATSGSQTEAAKLLGVSRRTLLNKIEALGIERPRKGRAPG